jgi:hypothetical protein
MKRMTKVRTNMKTTRVRTMTMRDDDSNDGMPQ